MEVIITNHIIRGPVSTNTTNPIINLSDQRVVFHLWLIEAELQPMIPLCLKWLRTPCH